MGTRGEAGRTGEPGEGFCVWRVRHRFSEGVCKVRSSKVWVFPFPWWEQSRVLSGCRAVSSAGAAGDQPELEEMVGRDELHPDVGIPMHPSWVSTQDAEWGSDVHKIPVKCWQLVAEV